MQRTELASKRLDIKFETIFVSLGDDKIGKCGIDNCVIPATIVFTLGDRTINLCGGCEFATRDF